MVFFIAMIYYFGQRRSLFDGVYLDIAAQTM
jgi:hypothetical protein